MHVLIGLQRLAAGACIGVGAGDRSQGQQHASMWLQGQLQGLPVGMWWCRPITGVRASFWCTGSCGGLSY